MAWFTQDALDFFAELELNNERAWFEKNKKRYEASVKQPMEAFAAEMISRMQQIDPRITMLPKEAVFRIYRDTRFSKDKTPYKTNAGLSISPGGKSDHSSGGVYFHLDARSMAVASGRYRPEPAEILAIRMYIASHIDEFAKLLEEPRFKATFGTIAGEKNKVLPAELRDAASRQPLIFNKQFFYWAEYDGKEALRDDLPDFVMMHVEVARPMDQFLTRASGS
ncbi:MAG: DUF2461 domain-containing protein [Fimbriimonadales bacterium]